MPRLARTEIKIIEKWKDRCTGQHWVSPIGSPLWLSGWKEVTIKTAGYGGHPAEFMLWIVNCSTGEVQCLIPKQFEKFFKLAPCLPSSTSRRETQCPTACPK